MDFFGRYQSPFGYTSGDNGVDSYGVNHSGFSTQDELQYQTLRTNRENELENDMLRQGIAQSSYPQYGTSFWQNAGLSGGGLDMASIGPTVQAALNLARSMPEQTQQSQQSPFQQIGGATKDMVSEYFKMKKHNYKNLDDYHHCKANYNAASRGPLGYNTAKMLGDAKEKFDFYWNQAYKGKSKEEAQEDKAHDLNVNIVGRLRGDSGLYDNAENACADYRTKNPAFPKEYW